MKIVVTTPTDSAVVNISCAHCWSYLLTFAPGQLPLSISDISRAVVDHDCPDPTGGWGSNTAVEVSEADGRIKLTCAECNAVVLDWNRDHYVVQPMRLWERIHEHGIGCVGPYGEV